MNDIQSGSNVSIKDRTTQLLELDDDERAMQAEAQFAQLSQQLSAQLSQSINDAMAQMAQLMAQQIAMLQQIAALNQQAVAELKRPKSASISGIKTDASGRIVDAVVTTTPVTVQ